MRRAVFVALILSPAIVHPQASRELTAEEKARLFAPTADVRLSASVARIPMRGTDHAGNRKCPYFQVYVNGRGPFTFLYDTGAAYLIVSSKVAEAAKAKVAIDRGGHRDVVGLERLSLAGVEVRDVWAIRDDNWGVDGVIGFPTFGDKSVLFDFSRREILVSRKPMRMRGGFSVPYGAPLNVPTVPVRIGARTVPILLDTGDDAYGLEIRSSELGDAAIEHPPTPAGKVMNGAIAQQTATTTLRDSIVLGPVEARHAAVAINDDLPVGDFGYDMLRQFRFQIDPKRRRVTFQPLFRGRVFSLSVPARRQTRSSATRK